jgi:hypothetical protein
LNEIGLWIRRISLLFQITFEFLESNAFRFWWPRTDAPEIGGR